MVHLDDRPAIDQLLDDTHDECEREIEQVREQWAEEVIGLREQHEDRLNEQSMDLLDTRNENRRLEGEIARLKAQIRKLKSDIRALGGVAV